MPISKTTQKVTIGLLAVPESSAAVIYGLHEVFSCVGTIWEGLTGQKTQSREMRPLIIAETTETIITKLKVPIAPDATFTDQARMDVIIIPDLFIEPDKQANWYSAINWLNSQREKGAVICSVCTGSLLLAQTGLLDGREATTHWSASKTFKIHHPKVDLKIERVLVPSGPEHGIITSGGSASWTDLSLYLIARFCGEEEARRIAKIFLFGDHSQGQLPFAAMVRPRQHTDATISKCQTWIADHYDVTNPVAEMTTLSGLNPRTFKRRFHASTGYKPIDYVQSLRIEEAKHALETTIDTIDDISEQVGYEDGSSFRRLFKRLVGISPNEYRRRYRYTKI
ncbi:GlxA family transcriptional regulator [Kiloniella sp.]|uniref:GlxA family transcriptional regulator n=1 Tax=Kiloniella sp. TaxID=1938587 RepID=UPI003A8FA433